MPFGGISFNIKDVALVGVGAIISLLLLALRQLYYLLSSPSVESIQQLATAPIPQIGDNQKITIWGFNLSGEHVACDLGITDDSPFVMRVECYLRLINQDYVKVRTKGLSECPRRLAPIANVFGTMVDDSNRILQVIMAKIGDNDEGNLLNEDQKAKGHLIRNTLFYGCYYVGLYMAFATNEGRAKMRKGLTVSVPGPLVPLIANMIFRSQTERLNASGFGKMPPEEIHQQARKDLQALANLLGKHEYMLGTDKPTSYDVDVYSFLAPMYFHPVYSKKDWIEGIKKDLPTILAFMNRMRSHLFPELKKVA